ncbi:hypothetical protein PENSPDRAFT_660464 [Peniophora sp. CONT]|nr:hypothetical protein PENSPDRAFT_660464 [Peniophora sp. CONT]
MVSADQDLTVVGPGSSPNQILKGIYIRGIAEAARRNPGTDLALYIEAYIYVQARIRFLMTPFNSLLDHARAPAPNDSYYSRAWAGPPNSPSGITSSAGGPTPTSTFGSSPAKSRHTGAIAGGVVGGVIAAVVAIATVLWCRRWRHTGVVNMVERDVDSAGNNSVQPFISRPAYNPTPTSSKLARLNESTRQNIAPSLPVPLAASEPDTTHDQGTDREAPDIAELPSLIQRLNNLLQGRYGELPPYER